MALKKPVTEATIEQATKDIEASGGEVTHVIRTGFQAIICSLPNDQFSVMDKKDYVDFIEKDQEGKKNKENELKRIIIIKKKSSRNLIN